MTITQSAMILVKGSALNTDLLSNMGNLYIDSNFVNNGNATGGGNYFVAGDWENNMVFTADTSTVELNGANQLIKGSSVSDFYNLTLTGTGIKSLELDATSSGVLRLNDRELATDTHTFYVNNPSLSAITNTATNSSDSGFVSSNDGGYLSREMQGTSGYLFPVGSSNATLRYRPAQITPSSASQQTFEVRLANIDATTEGYDRSQVDSTICTVNPDYYHQIRRTAGSGLVTIELFYDATADFSGTTIAQWQGTSQWSSIGPVSLTSNPSPVLSIMTQTAWNDFAQRAFAMANEGIQAITSTTGVACTGLSNGSSSVSVSSGTAPYTYQWDDPASQTDATAVDLPTGTYTVTITDSSGCVKTETISITGLGGGPTANAGNDATITEGDPITLQGSGGGTYQWSPADDLGNPNDAAPVATPSETVTYTLVVTDSLGCTDTAYVTVTITPELFYGLGVPNVFSPNGDGENDRLFVQGTGDGVEALSLIIYDRWGEKVYETDCCCSQTCGWNGNFRGKPMNTAVYVYILEATVKGSSFEKHGNITLIR